MMQELETLPKSDLRDRADVHRLITLFYRRLLDDPSISYLFTDVVSLDFDHHIPRIVDFWESILFQTDGYSGNPMEVHQRLHEKSQLTAIHFEIWLRHFTETADENFSGPTTERAKQRAISIAMLIKIKLLKNN